jgi:hypothetical protein
MKGVVFLGDRKLELLGLPALMAGGPEHGRTIPLADMSGPLLLRCTALLTSGLRLKKSLETSSGCSGSGRRQLFAGLRDAQHFGKRKGESR